MLRFSDLINRCASFMLGTLHATHARTSDALQTSSATPLIANLRMVNLQKAIFSIGVLSLFEARLQDSLDCHNGFDEAFAVLDVTGEQELKEQFKDLILAINVLKHGHGRSYDVLVAKAAVLPFQMKLPGQSFFFEGDVAEVSTLIKADDQFVLLCTKTVDEVCAVIRKARDVDI